MTGASPTLQIELQDAPSLFDIGDRIRAESDWSVTYGTQNPGTKGFVADAGKLSCTLDNLDRELDPLNAAAAHYPDLTPGNQLYMFGDFNATTYTWFKGFADDWLQEYPNSGRDQVVPFTATDDVGYFSQAQIAIERPQEYSGARIAAIAAAVGYTGGLHIAHGNATVSALKFGQLSAWSHMQAVAQAEWGDLYFDPDFDGGGLEGLNFRSRDQIASDARSIASQATYTDQPGGPFTYAGAQLVALPIVNDCTIGYDIKGNEVNFQDAASIASRWKVRSEKFTLPLHYAGQAQQYARWVVDRYKLPIYSFGSVTFKFGDLASADPAVLFPEILSRRLSDMVTVTRTPRGGGAPIVRDCWIRGIQHQGGQGVWKQSTFWLQDASWITGLFHIDVDHMDTGSGSDHVLSL